MIGVGQTRWRTGAPLAVAAGVAALGAIGGSLRLPPLGSVLLAIAAWMVLAEWHRRTAAAHDAGCVEDAAAAGLTMALVFLAVAGADAGLDYFFRWWPADGSARALWKFGAVRFAVLFAALVPVVERIPPRWLRAGVIAGAAGSLAISFAWLIRATGGEALYRDDHASFLFRLWALARSFPAGVFYNPFWNAGAVDVSPLSTGAVLVGAPLAPVWAAWLPHRIYTWVAGAALLGAVPALAAASARWAGGGRLAMAIAALLAAGSGTGAYLWAMRFGTVPAVLSAAFIMPVCACAARILGEQRPGWKLALLFAASLVGFLSWPAAVVMALAPAAAVLLEGGWRSPRRFAVLSGGAALAALALAPSAVAVALHGGVGRLAAVETPAPALADILLAGVHNLRAVIRHGHPLLVFVGLATLSAWPDRRARVIFGATVLGLAAVTGWGEMWKPEFQLRRAEVPMWMAAAVPAALACERLLSLPGAAW